MRVARMIRKVSATAVVLQHATFMGFAVLAATLAIIQPVIAQSESVAIADLTPAGWHRNSELLGLKIDRYRPASGSFELDLIAFPVTDLNASEWLDSVTPLLAKEKGKLDNNIRVLSSVDAGLDEAGVDVATRELMVLRPGKGRSTLFLKVSAIVRQDEPVQFSLMRMVDTQDETDRNAADVLGRSARLPVNEGAAILGLASMFQLMTNPLLYPAIPAEVVKVVPANPQSEKIKSLTAKNTGKPPAGSTAATPVSVVRRTDVLTAVSDKSPAALFYEIPGPKVKLTGGMLGALPAGYRMQLDVTNYWVSADQMSTRQKHFRLTADGQFEKSYFSINGSLSGLDGSVFAGDQTGSAGSVYGNTNPGGEGARPVAMSRLEGLDPEKYGTYFISGKQIELLYANGKLEKLPFETDGYSEVVMDAQRYLNVTPNGCENKERGQAQCVPEF